MNLDFERWREEREIDEALEQFFARCDGESCGRCELRRSCPEATIPEVVW